MPRLEFFFDCSSPWTYLAFTGVRPLCARLGVDIDWRPILVGGVFNAVNPEVYRQRENPNPLRMAYTRKDCADWAAHYGIAIGQPPIFPVNSVKAMRGALIALDRGELVAYAERVFQSYWGELRDISDDGVLRAVAERCGIDGDDFLARTRAPEAKAALRANTDELIARGGFGSPTMFVDRTDMYFGNDRLALVERALLRRGAQSAGSKPKTEDANRPCMT